ncbi:TPA: protein tyrosine phosphatase [Serratia marcescens]|uniref:arsenate reductase/protein-tyrosine-phosphatase family protein n=1 Tax=Serratia TaxID=613 RepID=UPI000D72B84F|nr:MULTISPECIES: protein tyrosine phosphatase [Serratia]AWQ47177.1 protein tyrosine phosphatase [Serratia marcescens]MBX9329812.1 protein tyrosine phosphatase [Serratia marcescens]TWY25825.1 protein tyrosine phosphatase [Serratia marcescens]TYR73753.1 protein tyrosine phosphatase [Serratia marcescens]WMC77033.1 protein tyrosine phosphatase [Serratia nevei]
MFDSILVVCVGNICRSPTGERLLQQLLPDKDVSSAGLAALVGKAADKKSIFVADINGLSLNGHKARQLTRELCRQYSLILVMERKHIDAVARLVPEVRGKTMLFGHWLGEREIPDPYGKSQEAFDFVYNLLAESARKWSQVLNK